MISVAEKVETGELELGQTDSMRMATPLPRCLVHLYTGHGTVVRHGANDAVECPPSRQRAMMARENFKRVLR